MDRSVALYAALWHNQGGMDVRPTSLFKARRKGMVMTPRTRTETLLARTRVRTRSSVFDEKCGSPALFCFWSPPCLPSRLPDGAVKQFDAPVSVADVAAVHRPRPRQGRARRQGRRQGRRHVVSSSTATPTLAIVTDKDPQGVDVIRHSTAHLLAYAVKELFPDAQVTIGPVIEDGFYYDFAYKRPFTPEDLAAIEKRMAELAKKDEPVARTVMPRDDAVKFFEGMGEHYKAEIIASIPAERGRSRSTREGGFIDLCRGPHVPSTGKLKVFKLMKVAGAYWRGDSRNEMLQRIYGTAWAKKEDLDAYLTPHRGSREARPPQARPRSSTSSTCRTRRRAWCSGIRRAGRSGSRSSSTCAASTRTTATRK